MDMRKYYGESFIRVIDVADGPLDETIAVIRQGKYDKPDLIFESGDILSLNATNFKALIRAYGSNSDDWIGKEIKLKKGQTEYQGEPQDSVVIEPVSPALSAKEKAAAALKSDKAAKSGKADFKAPFE
jgi:hypothetical protein